MAARNDHSIFSMALAAMISCSFLSSIEAQIGGFSVELIHRDSPKYSRFYNQLETPSQRTINALQQSVSRVNRFTPSCISRNEAQADIISDHQGVYLMNISIGTPPFEILAIADTGSHLTWTQCKPCPGCFKQDTPLFNPNSSSTYKKLSCTSRQCLAMLASWCLPKPNSSCLYSMSYGDGSFSNGVLAIDTLTLSSTTGRPVAFPRTVFGCGHHNKGIFRETGSGIIGLGGGSASIITQMGTSIAGKFSYCLVPISSESGKSKISFGQNAVVSGSGVISTPLIHNLSDVYYFLTLEAISVDSDKLEFTGSSFGTKEGNIIIDSGTTLTFFPNDFYSKLERLVASKIGAKRVEGPNQELSLCYEAQNDFTVPNITVHFTNADVKLSRLNTFVSVSHNISCFSFGTVNDMAIYGNLAQMNFLVGYDIQNQVVSFKPTDCTKQY